MSSDELTHHLYVRTDPGLTRDANEDSVGQLELPDGHLVVVADGMGGHQAGDVASQITVREVLEHVRTTADEDPRERLYIAIEKAHSAVLEHAREYGTLDMGSTVVACFIQGREVHVAHVGDSRLYLIRDGAVAWTTRDHTRIRFLVDAGLLSPEEAEDHPEGNVITRAVGHDPADLDTGFVVDVRNVPLQVRLGDSLLLCSDGLYDMVNDDEILSLLAGRDVRTAVDALVDRANAADRSGRTPGGHDNITVALIHFGEDRGAVPPELEEQTLEPPTGPTDRVVFASEGDVRTTQPRLPAATYQPRRSTLVPEPTLEDETTTLAPGAVPAAGQSEEFGTGTVEMLSSPRSSSATDLSPTLEVKRLRAVSRLLGIVVVLLLVTTAALGGAWLMARDGGSGDGDVLPVNPPPAGDEVPTPDPGAEDTPSEEGEPAANDDDSAGPGEPSPEPDVGG